MKLRPLAWVVLILGLAAPVVLMIAMTSDSRTPTDRYGFLHGATLANYYPPRYSTGLRYQRGNSYVFRLTDDWNVLKREISASKDWKHIGTTRRGSEVYRHANGPRIYVSPLATSENPESRSRIYLVDSVRRVGWIERQFASAWFSMQRAYLKSGL